MGTRSAMGASTLDKVDNVGGKANLHNSVDMDLVGCFGRNLLTLSASASDHLVPCSSPSPPSSPSSTTAALLQRP